MTNSKITLKIEDVISHEHEDSAVIKAITVSFENTDVTLQVPDTRKFFKQTGWEPKYSFEQSVEFLLNHCRKRVELEKWSQAQLKNQRKERDMPLL